MSKSVFITNGEHAFNQLIATRMLNAGHRVALQATGAEAANSYAASVNSDGRLYTMAGTPADEAQCAAMLEEAIAANGGLDVMIHGNEMIDEEKWFEEQPDALDVLIPDIFQQIFMWSKAAVGYMIKLKSGKIVFPIIYDTLCYDRYPVSPIVNHGKISMMKCLSRECSAFRIDVNVMTFGYYDAGFDQAEKKEKKRGLEIYGLKPALKPLDEMMGMLDFLIEAPGSLIGGQNIEIGVGVETNL